MKLSSVIDNEAEEAKLTCLQNAFGTGCHQWTACRDRKHYQGKSIWPSRGPLLTWPTLEVEHRLWAVGFYCCFVFWDRSHSVTLTAYNSFCRLGCPQTQRYTNFSLLNTGIKGLQHHALLSTLFLLTFSQPWPHCIFLSDDLFSFPGSQLKSTLPQGELYCDFHLYLMVKIYVIFTFKTFKLVEQNIRNGYKKHLPCWVVTSLFCIWEARGLSGSVEAECCDWLVVLSRAMFKS